MKKKILAIGIIAIVVLFIGMAFVSIEASVETETKIMPLSPWLSTSYSLYLNDVTFLCLCCHSKYICDEVDGYEYFRHCYWLMTIKGTISDNYSRLSDMHFNNGDYIELVIVRGTGTGGRSAISRGRHDYLRLGGSGNLVFLTKYEPPS